MSFCRLSEDLNAPAVRVSRVLEAAIMLIVIRVCNAISKEKLAQACRLPSSKDIIQFSSAVYYCNEAEGKVEVEAPLVCGALVLLHFVGPDLILDCCPVFSGACDQWCGSARHR